MWQDGSFPLQALDPAPAFEQAAVNRMSHEIGRSRIHLVLRTGVSEAPSLANMVCVSVSYSDLL
jgi:hypothetical protein